MAKKRSKREPEEEETDGADPPVVEAEEGDQDETEDAKQKRQRKRKRKKKEGKDDDGDGDKPVDGDHNNNQQVVVKPTEEDSKKMFDLERTIYMEGIPFACTEEDVREFFRSNGVKELSDVRLPVWQDSGRLRGYGHILFATIEDQKLALTLDKKYIGKRYVTIQAAQAPKNTAAALAAQPVDPNRNPSRTIILNNLSYDATEEDIAGAMQKYGGKIVEGGVRVVRRSDTGGSKGFAYVEFEKQDTAMAVVKDAGSIVICSRPCRVDYDHGRVRGSFRTADRKLWHKEFKQ